jgi:hypothetical protein
VTPPLSIRARFERFPATLKGAFIIRGQDANPHQVVLRGARVVPFTGGDGRSIPIAGSTLDVAPRQDVFVPFEAGVAELDPGWYDLECDVDVDGVPGTYPGGKRFSVAWPRGSTRRGALPLTAVVKVGRVRFALDRLDCAPDHVTLRLTSAPPTDAEIALAADDADVPVLDVERDEATGAATVTAYPVLKSQSKLRIEVRAAGASASAVVPLG